MTTILVVCDNYKWIKEAFEYLYNSFSEKNIHVSPKYNDTIVLTNFCIIFRRNEAKYIRGLRPDYHIAYGSDVNEYLLAVGSIRLIGLDQIVTMIFEKEQKL